MPPKIVEFFCISQHPGVTFAGLSDGLQGDSQVATLFELQPGECLHPGGIVG